MSYKITTHNGKAHMDELLGIALLAYYKDELPNEIIRIHPEDAASLVKENKFNKDDFFIDCGLELDPERNLFDHHHSKDIGCAALLIFEYFFPQLLETNLHEYIKLVSLVDTQGPTALDDFKFKSDSLYYFSFSQKIILKEFEKNPLLISKIFLDGLVSIIEFEKEKEKALNWINSDGNITIEKVGHINLLRYNNPPPLEFASGVKAVDGDIVDENDIDVIYSYDKEDATLRTLFRTFKGHDKLDLSLATVNEVQFCHKGGFLLKFRPKNKLEWNTIIKESTL